MSEMIGLKGYQKLQIISDWTTRIELGGESLDFDKYYDIKTPTEQLFEGCRVYRLIYHHKGLGGMSEDSTTIIPFFEAAGLESKLQSGFLMKVNEQVTTQKYKVRKEKQDEIIELKCKGCNSPLSIFIDENRGIKMGCMHCRKFHIHSHKDLNVVFKSVMKEYFGIKLTLK